MISGIELDEEQARITVRDVPDQPGHAARIFRRVADDDIYLDMIVQNVSTIGSPNLSFTVKRKDARRALAAVAAVAGEGVCWLELDVAKISVLGVGMRSHAGVAARVFGALARLGIRPTPINTSEMRINIAVELERGREAQECLARAFLPRPRHESRPHMRVRRDEDV